jgi:ligand-binding sensor domain-containing protein
MDPANPSIVYAGTTEGLWKSTDAGHSFEQVTPPNVVVNGIVIDSKQPQHILLATDRGGVLVSNDGAHTFSASNSGFSQRQVAALLVDQNDPSTIYAGLINDKEYGGVFVSHDSGSHWQQMSAGLDGRDVFTLMQTKENTLVAGTNRGIFAWKQGSFRWEPINTILTEHAVPERRTGHARYKAAALRTVISRSELQTRVNALAIDGDSWYAASPSGLFVSNNQGVSWRGGAQVGLTDFVSVDAEGPLLAAATPTALAVSVDAGQHWYSADVPSYINEIYDVTIGPEATLWIATRQGVFRSNTNGDTWEHVLGGLPAMHVSSISYDRASHRMFASSIAKAALYMSADNGHHWQLQGDTGWQVRGVAVARDHLFVNTAYDGVLSNEEEHTTAAVPLVTGQNQ